MPDDEAVSLLLRTFQILREVWQAIYFCTTAKKWLHFRHLKTELISKELFGAKMTHMPYECSRRKKELGCHSLLFCNLAALFSWLEDQLLGQLWRFFPFVLVQCHRGTWSDGCMPASSATLRRNLRIPPRGHVLLHWCPWILLPKATSFKCLFQSGRPCCCCILWCYIDITGDKNGQEGWKTFERRITFLAMCVSFFCPIVTSKETGFAGLWKTYFQTWWAHASSSRIPLLSETIFNSLNETTAHLEVNLTSKSSIEHIHPCGFQLTSKSRSVSQELDCTQDPVWGIEKIRKPSFSLTYTEILWHIEPYHILHG